MKSCYYIVKLALIIIRMFGCCSPALQPRASLPRERSSSFTSPRMQAVRPLNGKNQTKLDACVQARRWSYSQPNTYLHAVKTRRESGYGCTGNQTRCICFFHTKKIPFPEPDLLTGDLRTLRNYY
jgi:hypothetical protein